MQPAVPEFAVRVSDLVVGFGRQVVIDHLSLDVRKGEILGLVYVGNARRVSQRRSGFGENV